VALILNQAIVSPTGRPAPAEISPHDNAWRENDESAQIVRMLS
jgi:hypothetical protein